jgi:hypothetical protein
LGVVPVTQHGWNKGQLMTDEQGHIDQAKPSIARVYDYLLGGKGHCAIDRAVGDQFKVDLPGSVAIAYANRHALVRGVRNIALNTGIRQFLDIGSGLPTADNVHQVAQRHAPGSRVVYVDNDPIVLADGRALLEQNENTTVIQADLRTPEAIRKDPDVGRFIDFDQPVAVILSAILHHLNDDENPGAVVAFWRDQVPSGSHFFISHFRSGHNQETREAEARLQASFGRGRWRTDEEIAELFAGLDLLPPGIVPASLWRPEESADLPRVGGDASVWEELIVAGLAVKP